jgi:hypothetical protein
MALDDRRGDRAPRMGMAILFGAVAGALSGAAAAMMLGGRTRRTRAGHITAALSDDISDLDHTAGGGHLVATASGGHGGTSGGGHGGSAGGSAGGGHGGPPGGGGHG